jgi:hypothetical protein
LGAHWALPSGRIVGHRIRQSMLNSKSCALHKTVLRSGAQGRLSAAKKLAGLTQVRAKHQEDDRASS